MQRASSAIIAAGLLLTGTAAAQAADMPVKAPRPVSAQVFSWTGFYVGANAGGAWSQGDSDPYNGFLFPGFVVLPPAAPIITVILGQAGTLPGAGNSSGFIGGGQIGYNWQVKQFVLGVEADVVGMDLSGSTASASRTGGPPLLNVPVTQTVTVDFGRIDWMASFRGRLGYAADRALFYVTGGGAVAQVGGVTTTVTNGPGIGIPAGTSSIGTGSTTRWGWTVGAGVEWAFNNNWSVAGEYRYTDFGSRGTAFAIPDGFGGTFATGTTNARLTVDQVTARLNYRFGGPVVAKY